MTYLEKFRSSKANSMLQRILRVFQFLSPVISLGLFASRLAKIARLQHRLSASNGAVAGILAAAIVYTFFVALLTFCLKHGGPKPLRWLLILGDLLFMGAFIGVAYLTRPHGGSSGPCTNSKYGAQYGKLIPKHQNCSLPWGTFLLAIISTILHMLTAIFHEVKDHRQNKQAIRDDHENNGYQNGQGNDGYQNGQGRGHEK